MLRQSFFAAALIAASCHHPQAQTPSPPPVVIRAVMPADPCANLSDEECTLRLAFVRKAVDSTVQVGVQRYTAKDGLKTYSGTGEVVDAAGTVLTAYHVVQDAAFLQVTVRRLGKDGLNVEAVRSIQVELVAKREDMDLALLRPVVRSPEDQLPPPFPIRREAPAIGEDLWHFGNVTHWNHGPVTQTSVGYATLKGVTQVAVSCRHGDSGGPFVDVNGKLVGVLLHKDGIDGRGNTYFMPIAAALDALSAPDAQVGATSPSR